MPENETRPEHYNRNAESRIAKLVTVYQLSKEEKGKIWELTGERNKLLGSQQQYYNDNREQLVAKEYDKLRGAQSPQAQYNLGPAQPRNGILMDRATRNVYNENEQALKDINKNIDKRISNVLENAREEGRGPKSELQQDFDRARDRDR